MQPEVTSYDRSTNTARLIVNGTLTVANVLRTQPLASGATALLCQYTTGNPMQRGCGVQYLWLPLVRESPVRLQRRSVPRDRS
jgi:hypothetical protein